MPLPDIPTITIGFHAATLVPLAVALQKFGDRSEMFQKSLAGVGETMERMRRRVAAELEAEIASAFPRPGAVTQASPILDGAGNRITAFVQGPAALPSSEAFRNCIHEFASRDESSLRGYARLHSARDGWARAAKVVSWSVLIALAWELLAFGLTGVACGLLKTQVDDWVLLSSFIPTGLLAVLFIGSFAAMLWNHDSILDIRRAHDSL
jgi:hypothetical protein